MVFSIDVRRSPTETVLESDRLDQSRPFSLIVTRCLPRPFRRAGWPAAPASADLRSDSDAASFPRRLDYLIRLPGGWTTPRSRSGNTRLFYMRFPRTDSLKLSPCSAG